jgi:hypothetical protein
LAHRVLLQAKAQYGGVANKDIIQSITDSEKVPR